MSKQTPLAAPARLFGLLAREAPIGVIFRRGPTRHEQLILWDTRNDTFTPGQWFKGRIYRESADLSPNGELLVYVARKMNHRTIEDRDVGPVWRAVSKPPYFTALALWPMLDIYLDSGGWFIDNQTLAVVGRGRTHPNFPLPSTMKVLSYDWWRKTLEEKGGETRFNVEPPLKGWQVIRHRIKNRDDIQLPPLEIPDGWSKPDKDNRYLLIHVHDPRRRGQSDREGIHYTLRDLHTGLEHPLGDSVDWVDWDQRNRLVIARDGKLFTGTLQQGTFEERELADFNHHQFEPIVAPPWAQKW
jgi:hypothetical protein